MFVICVVEVIFTYGQSMQFLLLNIRRGFPLTDQHLQTNPKPRGFYMDFLIPFEHLESLLSYWKKSLFKKHL